MHPTIAEAPRPLEGGWMGQIAAMEMTAVCEIADGKNEIFPKFYFT